MSAIRCPLPSGPRKASDDFLWSSYNSATYWGGSFLAQRKPRWSDRHYNESTSYCLRPALPLRRGLLRPGFLFQNAFSEDCALEGPWLRTESYSSEQASGIGGTPKPISYRVKERRRGFTSSQDALPSPPRAMGGIEHTLVDGGE